MGLMGSIVTVLLTVRYLVASFRNFLQARVWDGAERVGGAAKAVLLQTQIVLGSFRNLQWARGRERVAGRK